MGRDYKVENQTFDEVIYIYIYIFYKKRKTRFYLQSNREEFPKALPKLRKQDITVRVYLESHPAIRIDVITMVVITQYSNYDDQFI